MNLIIAPAIGDRPNYGTNKYESTQHPKKRSLLGLMPNRNPNNQAGYLTIL